HAIFWAHQKFGDHGYLSCPCCDHALRLRGKPRSIRSPENGREDIFGSVLYAVQPAGITSRANDAPLPRAWMALTLTLSSFEARGDDAAWLFKKTEHMRGRRSMREFLLKPF